MTRRALQDVVNERRSGRFVRSVGFVIPSTFDIRALSFDWFFPTPDRSIVFGIDGVADFLKAAFFQDAS